MDTESQARKIAARVAGIREDQVDVAVAAYRDALSKMHDEPQWRAVIHIMGCCTCIAEGTEIEMHFASKTKNRPAERVYVLYGKSYETFSEARAVELAETAKFAVRSVSL